MINTLLFVAGINTLLQTWFGTRLPVVIGGSYAFIIPAISVALSRRFNFYIDPHQVTFIFGRKMPRDCFLFHFCFLLKILFLSFYFSRGLENRWRLFKEHWLLRLSCQWSLVFWDCGGLSQGMILSRRDCNQLIWGFFSWRLQMNNNMCELCAMQVS